MDIQEAIEHARQVAEGCDAKNRDCAYQHDKLADWLTVLKQIAEIFNYDPNDPAQLKQLFDKLRGWQQAEQDGRMVVLPCKIGDKVYLPLRDGVREAKVIGIKISVSGKDTVLHLDIEAGEYRWGSDKGRTWFVTRQEAEAAVEGKEDT